MKKSMG